MTTIGHALTGLSLGLLSLPKGESRSKTALSLLLFAVLANIPDISLPGWGHDLYHVSHSLIVNGIMLLSVGLAVGLARPLRELLGGWPTLSGGALAWLSHLLLDSFYNHGQGIAIFWPVSEARLNLAMPWFSTLRHRWAPDLHSLRVALTELAFYGAFLLLALFLRRALLVRRVERGDAGPDGVSS